jgi:hypothetical protein
MFLKATVRPDLRPDDPDQDDKKSLVDENTWVYDKFSLLVDSLEKAI